MSEGDLKELQDEEVDLGVRRRAEYADDEDGTLALVIPKREGGGEIEIPLVEHARTVFERTDGSLQDNTLLAVRPLAEVGRNRPVQQHGVTTNTGIATAMLRPGFLYVFFDNRLWRELEVGPDGKLSDVDLTLYREQAEGGDTPNESGSEGEWLDDILLPAMLQGQATLHRVRLAYSEIAWSWPYITWLEANPGRLEARTTPVGHAHAVILDMEGWLSMQTGFPAGRVADQPALRERDLGIELLLQAPEAFTPDFTAPAGDEQCAKLKALWEQAGETERAASLALECEAGDDLLGAIRNNPGIVAVALPDPLFALRHALAQIHLAQHYLDGLDSRLADNPLGHSAKLIRQALYAEPSGGTNPLAEFRSAIDPAKLDATLEQAERNAALEVLRAQLDALQRLASQGQLTAVLRDFTSHHQLGICEGYALCGDLFGVLQQLPGVLIDQGDARQEARTRQLLKTLLTDRDLQALWSSEEQENGEEGADDDTNDGSGNFRPAFLRQLAANESDIDEALAESLGLETLGLIARNLTEREQAQRNEVLSLTNAGKVGGLVSTVLGQWSQAVLRAAERVGDNVEVIHLRRTFTAVGNHANLIDGNLGGELRVMQRGDVDLSRYVIIGVHGDGIEWGLTDRDRTSGVFQTQRDYLYAEQVDPRGNMRASTSPARMSEEVNDAIRQVAGHTLVFVLPVGHPEAAKVAQLRLAKLADQVKVVIDGPAVSRLLVGFAIYNIGVEIARLKEVSNAGESTALQWSKIMSSLVDLSAAQMKLYTTLYPNSNSKTGVFVQRNWFDIKSWPVIGARLSQVGASTLVRTIGLFNFFAGVSTVGVSSWELRNSLQVGDQDAAIGHGIAVAGGVLFLASPLMAGLVVIPGWGWALLGLGLAIGGTSYAAMNQDTPFEQLLRQGPLGTHPDRAMTAADDAIYYPQLLTQLSPAQIEVTRYGSLGVEERQALLESVWESTTDTPCSRDYVVTISTPLISRYKIGETLSLAVQELEQTDTGTITPLGTYERLSHITRAPEPFEIGKRLLLPQQSAVRFLVKRKVAEESFVMGGTSVTSTARLRIALQARVEWELGEMVLPTPMLKEFKPFVEGQHDALPARSYRTVNNPIADFIRSFTGRSQDPRYWYIKEFQV
jgi:hypothetical protein